MRYQDFTNPAGHFVPTLDGVRAFVPSPLPPRLDIAVLAEPMGDARAAIGELRGACEALASSAKDGDAHVEWFEGNFEAHEDDEVRRLGPDSIEPKRVKYKKFTR